MNEMESQLEECGVCHALHPYSELSCFDDTLICPDCMEDSTVICGRCGDRIWRDDDQGNEDSGHLCQSCYDRYYNTNNHPWSSTAGDTTFALAHNGVLSNDKRLRRQYDLPATKIETDSYIAVQLLEASEELSLSSLASMAEKLEGSFTITVMTDQDELYFIKGDTPMCIYHYEKLGFYIYASTEPILKTALKQINLKLGKPTKVKLDCGEILKIDAEGSTTRSQFDYTNIFMGYSHWPRWPVQPECWKPATNESYINDLKSIAAYYGIYEDEIDEMLADGVTPEEIEELLNGA